MANFITITGNVTTGALGGLSRSILIVTRETVSGYTPDPETGLIKILSSDEEAFISSNSTKYGLVQAIQCVFGQTYTPPHVYILSSSSGVTSSELNTAKTRPREWTFITLASQTLGVDDEANYLADLTTIGTWLNSNSDKLCVHTFAADEAGGSITIPTALALDGAINSNNRIKTIITNQFDQDDAYSPKIYHNVACAWMAFCLYGTALSRSWGSLSDAHDFAIVSGDTYSSAVRSQIINANLGQYNDARDRGGSVFVYDTLMNDSGSPPDSKQIESSYAIIYIEDYTYITVRNALQAAGKTGVSNDDAGIQEILALANKSLKDMFDLNFILSNAAGEGDYSVKALTAEEVTVLDPTWQTSGVWPSGVITATVRPFGAAHYVTINFNFQ